MPTVKNKKQYLNKQELAKRWRVCTRTIELWVNAGKCPKPFKPSHKTVLWALADITKHERKRRP